MQEKAALIIIFNHRYDKNIEVLEAMYGQRFTHIYHLVPFYDGDKPNVIPVYENSLCFQGYIAQGLKHFYDEDFEHYLFVADDLILNPGINENNYKEIFNIGSAAGFIPEILEVHQLTNNDTIRFVLQKWWGKRRLYWWRLKDLAKYRHWVEGVESEKEMPSYTEAAALLNQHGYKMKPLTHADVFGYFPLSLRTKRDRREVLKYIKWLGSYKSEYKIAYPVVASYSDVVIVPKASIKTFTHYCGVFAANGLFVEFAIPTALLLSTKKVVSEPVINKRGAIYWLYTPPEAAAYEEAMKPYEYNLQNLLKAFPADKLYIHPIKLSRWKTG
jgi:hypothetical protein